MSSPLARSGSLSSPSASPYVPDHTFGRVARPTSGTIKYPEQVKFAMLTNDLATAVKLRSEVDIDTEISKINHAIEDAIGQAFQNIMTFNPALVAGDIAAIYNSTILELDSSVAVMGILSTVVSIAYFQHGLGLDVLPLDDRIRGEIEKATKSAITTISDLDQSRIRAKDADSVVTLELDALHIQGVVRSLSDGKIPKELLVEIGRCLMEPGIGQLYKVFEKIRDSKGSPDAIEINLIRWLGREIFRDSADSSKAQSIEFQDRVNGFFKSIEHPEAGSGIKSIALAGFKKIQYLTTDDHLIKKAYIQILAEMVFSPDEDLSSKALIELFKYYEPESEDIKVRRFALVRIIAINKQLSLETCKVSQKGAFIAEITVKLNRWIERDRAKPNKKLSDLLLDIATLTQSSSSGKLVSSPVEPVDSTPLESLPQDSEKPPISEIPGGTPLTLTSLKDNQS